MNSNRTIARIVISLLVILLLAALTACSSHTASKAGEGAVTGAVVGAAGGMVSAMIFGGDVGEAAARGAAWGGTTGAVAGGIQGAQQDQAKKAQQEKSIEKLKTDLGEDAFNGLVALTECKHEVALGYSRTAVGSENKNHALAGLWIEILTYADSREEDKARALFSDLVSKDPKISSEDQAEETMRKALQGLMDVRAEYNLPKVCG